MMKRQVRGIVAAGLLCAALAGCAKVVANADATGAGTGTGTATPSTASTQVGCASVNLATAVTVRRSLHLMEPASAEPLEVTQTKPALVRALFRDLCQAVSHPTHSKFPVSCPMEDGLYYNGTFYAGSRTLAAFTYAASGCQMVSVMTPGKVLSAMMFGPAAAAAPHLATDLAAVIGKPVAEVYKPPVAVNPGGPMQQLGQVP
jgi:hypothetical protein